MTYSSHEMLPFLQIPTKQADSTGNVSELIWGDTQFCNVGMAFVAPPLLLGLPLSPPPCPPLLFPLPSSNRSWPRERPTLLAKGLGFYLRTCPHLSALNWFWCTLSARTFYVLRKWTRKGFTYVFSLLISYIMCSFCILIFFLLLYLRVTCVWIYYFIWRACLAPKPSPIGSHGPLW
jgi:hypothetical protein